MKPIHWLQLALGVAFALGIPLALYLYGDYTYEGVSGSTSTPGHESDGASKRLPSKIEPMPDKSGLQLLYAKYENTMIDVLDNASLCSLEGMVRNKGRSRYTYVWITVNFYDRNGNLVATAKDDMKNLESEAIWNFYVIAMGNDVAAYKVAELAGYRE